MGHALGKKQYVPGENIAGPVRGLRMPPAIDTINQQVVVVTHSFHAMASRLGIVAHGGRVALAGQRMTRQFLQHKGRSHEPRPVFRQRPF